MVAELSYGRYLRLLFSAFAALQAASAIAQSTSAGTVLTYIPSSTVKLEQVIGDCDWQVEAAAIVKGINPVPCQRTTSQSATRYDVYGNGQGGSFEANGKMIFFFGDTISTDTSKVKYFGADPIAWSTSTDPEKGLLLNFYTQSNGEPLFVQPPGFSMGPDDIPNSGIFLNGQIYFICNTGSNVNLSNPQAADFSELVLFNETAQTFTGLRQISPSGGRFIGTSLHASGSNVYIFGAGPYRASDIYLQMVPASTFATGAGTQYFAGLVNGQPSWVNTEAQSVPVVQDNPSNGPAWPLDSPTVGNLSVIYSSALNLWLMTYDGGRQSVKTDGTYFTYATQPWGPWATPQLIFNARRDGAKGLGGFIHDATIVPDPPGDGLNGPVIGNNSPYTTEGGGFAPLLIERFTTVTGNRLRVYFNLSTWNPYTVVRLRSEFTISGKPAIAGVANAEGGNATIAPNTWVSIVGQNLSPAGDTRIWQASDFANNRMPTQLDSVSATVNGKSAYLYYISPTLVNVLTPPDPMQGPVSVQLTTNGVAADPFTVAAASLSPSLFVFPGNYVAALHLNGSLIGPTTLYPGASTPAKPGETIVLYANGFGPVSTPLVSGAVTQTGSLPKPPVIFIGGVAAQVLFAGLVAPGEFQFNIVVPASLSDGDQVIEATYDGAATPSGTLLTIRRD